MPPLLGVLAPVPGITVDPRVLAPPISSPVVSVAQAPGIPYVSPISNPKLGLSNPPNYSNSCETQKRKDTKTFSRLAASESDSDGLSELSQPLSLLGRRDRTASPEKVEGHRTTRRSVSFFDYHSFVVTDYHGI
jgi:hypothetical protein